MASVINLPVSGTGRPLLSPTAAMRSHCDYSVSKVPYVPPSLEVDFNWCLLAGIGIVQLFTLFGVSCTSWRVR